ncbi:MAG: hypothetical protein ABI333_09185 [bacterium]
MQHKNDDMLTRVEVTGRVVHAHHETENVRVALVVEEHDDEFGFDEYLVADDGRGEDLEDYVDDIVTASGWLQILDTGEPLILVRQFERW